MVKASPLWQIAALCTLAGSGWILTQAWPSQLGYPFAGCIHFICVGCVAASIAWRKPRPGLKLARVISLGVAGVCLFVLPAASLHFAAGAVPETSGLVLFCAIPAMTILGVVCFVDDSGRSRGFLLPSVVALGGACLLFPLQMPSSLRQSILFGLVAACCFIVAFAGIWMHRFLAGIGTAEAVALVGFSGAIVLGLYGVQVGWPVLGGRLIFAELLRGVIFDLPLVWLALWLMREVDPVRLSARFLLVPLISLLEGYAAMRIRPDVKTSLEMTAVLVGSLILLIKDEPEEIPGLRLR